jgi:TRAP-type C4-dicarboxylate transport system substrate-binding protein
MVVRWLVCASLAFAFSTVAGSVAPAAAQDKVTLKVAIFTPEPASSSRWFKLKKDELAKATGGKLDLELFFGSTMGPLNRHYELARTGVADMSWFQQGVTPGRFPLTELLHSPFLYPSGALGSIVAAKVSGDLLPEMRKEHPDIELGWVVSNRPSGIYDANKPIDSLDDMRGRRYRTPTPADVAIIKSIGAVPVGLPATEMAEGLQKGTINGVVTDPYGVFSFRIGNLVKYYADTVRTAITFGLAINKDSLAKLPADMKRLVVAMEGKEQGVLMARLTWEDNPVFLDYMKQSNIATNKMDSASEQKLRGYADQFIKQHIEELEKKGLAARAFYNKAKELSVKYEKEGL